jgi:hypothetical protein
MANPNLKNLSGVFGENSNIASIPTNPTSIVTCGPDQLLKINSLYISNIDGVNVASVDVDLFSGVSVLSYLIKGLNISAGGTVNVITFDSPLYLTESQSLRLTANVSGDLSAVVSYERIN